MSSLERALYSRCVIVSMVVCYSALQRVAVCCSVLHCVALCFSVLQGVQSVCKMLQGVAVCCGVPCVKRASLCSEESCTLIKESHIRSKECVTVLSVLHCVATRTNQTLVNWQ